MSGCCVATRATAPRPTRAMALVTDGLLRLFAAEPPFVRELRNRGLTLVNHASPVKRWLDRRALDS